MSDITEYKINPNGMYALYRKVGSNAPWRESASITNQQLKEKHNHE